MKLELFEYTALSADLSFSQVSMLKLSGIFGATLNGLITSFFGAPDCAPDNGAAALLCMYMVVKKTEIFE